MEPIVNIIDVVPAAIRVPTADLRVGDGVFDAFGRDAGHFTRVRLFKHVVQTTRSDGLRETWPVLDFDGEPATITIRRGE